MIGRRDIMGGSSQQEREEEKRAYAAYCGRVAFRVVASSLVFYFVLFHTSVLFELFSSIINVLKPIIYGFVIAYLLNPVMQSMENTFYSLMNKWHITFRRSGKTTVRVVCTFLSVGIVLLLVYLLLALIVPSVIDSIKNIAASSDSYIQNVRSFINNIFHDQFDLEKKANDFLTRFNTDLNTWIQDTFQPNLDGIMSALTNAFTGFFLFLKNIFLGVIVSIYLLIGKDRLKARGRRFLYAVLKTKNANRFIYQLRFIDDKFGGFLLGKIIDSFIIGIICYIFNVILGMPYALLIAVVVGVTNIVPFFGPFIGAIPSLLLIFVNDPIKSLIFLIFVIALQQFDGNLLGPKILGSSVGVSSFLVIIAILVGGGFFGLPGMIMSVPTFAVCFAFIQTFVLKRIRDKGMPDKLEEYHYLERVVPETGEIIKEDDTLKTDQSLYDRIKYRKPSLRKYDISLKVNRWDKTFADLEKEENEITGNVTVVPEKDTGKEKNDKEEA